MNYIDNLNNLTRLWEKYPFEIARIKFVKNNSNTLAKKKAILWLLKWFLKPVIIENIKPAKIIYTSYVKILKNDCWLKWWTIYGVYKTSQDYKNNLSVYCFWDEYEREVCVYKNNYIKSNIFSYFLQHIKQDFKINK
jgi:hypothetical protein